MGPVNVNNFTDGVASIHLPKAENIKKLGFFLIEVRKNILVALHLQPQTCNFLKFKLKMISTHILHL